MGQVLQFRLPLHDADELLADIDLITAVDVALRDIADAIPHVGLAATRTQLTACYDMLLAAYERAVETD
jgi:hypothetical protein